MATFFTRELVHRLGAEEDGVDERLNASFTVAVGVCIDATAGIVTLTGTQTLTNKTLTSPVVNVGSDANGDTYYRNGGVLVRLPKGSNDQVLTLVAGLPAWSDAAGGSFDISALTELAEAPAAGDLFAVVDVSANATKKMTAANLLGSAQTPWTSNVDVASYTLHGTNSSDVDAGVVTVNGGNVSSGTGSGGRAIINGGNAHGSNYGMFGQNQTGGNVEITAGNGEVGGQVYIAGGNASAGAFQSAYGGNVSLAGGNGLDYGGSVSLVSGNGGAAKGSISLALYGLASTFRIDDDGAGGATIGFFGNNYVGQGSHIADADLTDVHTKFNTLIAYLQSLGLLASS